MRSSSFIPQTGLKLTRTPSVRQQAMRRWMMALAAMLGLALVSALLGVFAVPESPVHPARTGPFSYYPS